MTANQVGLFAFGLLIESRMEQENFHVENEIVMMVMDCDGGVSITLRQTSSSRLHREQYRLVVRQNFLAKYCCNYDCGLYMKTEE